VPAAEGEEPTGGGTGFRIEDVPLFGTARLFCAHRRQLGHAVLPQRLDDAPLFGIRVLKLIQDDDRIHRRDQLADALAPMKDVADIASEEIEADAPLILREPEALGVLPRLLLCFLSIGQL